MDSARVEAYLRSICSVLDFYVGELWCARGSAGNEPPTFTFVQLYTSPSYEDFQSLLLKPQHRHNFQHQQQHPNGPQTDEEKHRFSPTICRGVCDGGQIVWANTCTSEGLVGRSDLPLNTAVGLPVCSIGNDLFIFVLFSVDYVPMTPNAVEFLCSLTRSITDGSQSFLPAATYPTVVKAANVKQFVGLWDMLELIETYASDVAFHLVPIERLQNYFDYEEYHSMVDIFNDFKQIRDSRFTTKQLESLRPTSEGERPRSLSAATESSNGWFHIMTSSAPTSTVAMDAKAALESDLDPEATRNYLNGKNLPKIAKDQSSMPTPGLDTLSSPFGSTAIDDVGPGAFTADLDAVSVDGWSWFGSEKEDTTAESVHSGIRHGGIDTRTSYRKNSERFHELMVALLGMTIMDAAELWLLADRQPELHLAAALHRDGVMNVWTTQSKDISLGKGADLPGQVIGSSHPKWDNRYDSHAIDDPSFPRAALASRLGVRTAFAVPLPGPRGSTAVLAFYSRCGLECDLLFVTLVVKASLLVAVGELDPEALAYLNVENFLFKPVTKILMNVPPTDINERDNRQMVAAPRANQSSNTITVQHMGSLAACNKMELNYFHRGGTGHAPGISNHTTLYTTDNNHHSQFSATAVQLQQQQQQQQHVNRLVPKKQSLPNPPKFFQQSQHHVSTGNTEYSSSGLGPTITPQQYYSRQFSNSTSNSSSYPLSNPPLLYAVPLSSNIPLHYSYRNQELAYNNPYNGIMPAHGMPLSDFGAPSSYHMQNLQSYQNASNFVVDERIMELSESPSMVISSASSANGTMKLMASSLQVETMEYGAAAPQLAPFSSSSATSVRSTSSSSSPIATMPPSPYSQSTFSSGSPVSSSSSAQNFGGKCKVDDCDQPPTSRSPYCSAHGGFRRCLFENCTKCAQGSTSYCIAHGGGRRCTVPGCDKGARDKFFCAAHGGGKRCSEQGCSKSAVGGSNRCTAHGGGKRCTVHGCTKSSQSNTNFCVRHGGGRKCVVPGCIKVARGKTDFCAAHGSTKCRVEGCKMLAEDYSRVCPTHQAEGVYMYPNLAGYDDILNASTISDSDSRNDVGLHVGRGNYYASDLPGVDTMLGQYCIPTGGSNDASSYRAQTENNLSSMNSKRRRYAMDVSDAR